MCLLQPFKRYMGLKSNIQKPHCHALFDQSTQFLEMRCSRSFQQFKHNHFGVHHFNPSCAHTRPRRVQLILLCVTTSHPPRRTRQSQHCQINASLQHADMGFNASNNHQRPAMLSCKVDQVLFYRFIAPTRETSAFPNVGSLQGLQPCAPSLLDIALTAVTGSASAFAQHCNKIEHFATTCSGATMAGNNRSCTSISKQRSFGRLKQHQSIPVTIKPKA